MTHHIIPETQDKKDRYEALIPQVESLISGEKDLVANLANMTSVLNHTFGFLWVGFYLVREGELVLGPFQGPVACTRIAKGKGVCGKAWSLKKTIIVPNVDEFPGHIACSFESRSEIVVPVIKNNEVKMVLDLDSDQLDDFDQVDQEYLEKLVQLIGTII